MDEFVASVKLIRFLAALRECGYEEVWINTESPHSSMLKGKSHVIAAPKRTKRNQSNTWDDVALWRLDEFSIGCGNGLEAADQAQIWEIADIAPGHYKL